MAYAGEIKAESAAIFALDLKHYSKKPYWVPADSLTAAESQATPQSAYWAIYTCIYSHMRNTMSPLVRAFTKFQSQAELRKGFMHVEMGQTLFHAIPWDNYPEVGKPITYKYYAIPRIFSEHIETDPVHLLAVYNFKEYQHAGIFPDMRTYDAVRSQTVEYCSDAINKGLKQFLHSVLLAGTPTAFVDDEDLNIIWSTLHQIDENYSKDGYLFGKDDDKAVFKKILGKAVGLYKSLFKNVLYFNPYSYAYNGVGSYDITITKPTTIDSQDKVKTYMQEVYIQKTGDEKNRPHKDLSRAVSLGALVQMIYFTAGEMVEKRSIRNIITFDPYSTAQATEEQFTARVPNKDYLVLIMSPDDLKECELGNVGFTGPQGTIQKIDFKIIEKAVGAVFSLHGLLPGQAYILDVRSINIFPFFEKLLWNQNKELLVEQFFLHYMFKWAFFRNMVGKKLVAVPFNPGINFYTKYLEDIKA